MNRSPSPPPEKHRLILALVIRPPHGERVLRPDHEGGPVATGLGERTIQRVQLRGGQADVDCAFGHGQQIRAGIPQELFEAIAQIVVGDPAMGLAAEVRHAPEDHVAVRR